MNCIYDNLVLTEKSLTIEVKHNRPILRIFNLLSKDWQRYALMFSIPFAIIYIVWNLLAFDNLLFIINVLILITLMNIIDNARVYFRNIEIPLDKISSIDIDELYIRIKYLNLIRYIEYDKQDSIVFVEQLKNIKPTSEALRNQFRSIYKFALGVGVAGFCMSIYLYFKTYAPISTIVFITITIYFTAMIAFSSWKLLKK